VKLGLLFERFRRRSQIQFANQPPPQVPPLSLPPAPSPNPVPDAVERFAATLRGLIDQPPWCLDFVRFTDSGVTIGGWALAPLDGPEHVGFMINDHLFEDVDYGSRRDDIAQLYWYMPRGDQAGVICSAPLTRAEVFRRGYATFSYVDVRTRRPFRPEHNYYYADDATNLQLPLPDAARRIRVHGADNAFAFLCEGFTNYIKLNLTLREVLQKDYADFRHILDWGCGCGRLTRYFRDRTPALLTGIDIDADNLAWCRAHLPFASFAEIPTVPPTMLPSNAYDLLIGISIFTHLKQEVEERWLAELQRLAEPGGVLMMTVHGNTTVGRAPYLASQQYDILCRDGFLDVGHNSDLGSVLDDDYYRNTLHTSDYIQANWSQYFDILAIIPGYIGNLQELVVMRKR
jgi:2-polyprenyl-3-methyl-5-hydroxy-6-metoxy-1,4-benzoquinol methylase